MSEPSVYPCPQCQIGVLQPKRMAYVRVINGLFVSVPDMPTHTCDVCGYQEFGTEALLVLEFTRQPPRSRQPQPSPRSARYPT